MGKNQDSNTESPQSLSLFGIPVKVSEAVPRHWGLIGVYPPHWTDKYFQGVVLNMETPKSYFMQAIDKIVEMHKRKQEDYTDTGEFANFEEAAQEGDISTLQFLNATIGNKSSRIRVLTRKQAQGKDARNESLEDSYWDRAVYSVIAYARYIYERDTKNVLGLHKEGMRPMTDAEFKGYSAQLRGNWEEAQGMMNATPAPGIYERLGPEKDTYTSAKSNALITEKQCINCNHPVSWHKGRGNTIAAGCICCATGPGHYE